MKREWMGPRRIKIIRLLDTLDVVTKVHFTCNICHRPIRCAFDSPANNNPFLQKMQVVGAGWRKNQQCPYCESNDRLRFTVEVMRKHSDILNKPCKVLEFAPIKGMELFLSQNPQCVYVTGDIVPERAQRVLDITKIDFPDAEFDYVICNHVLEHIQDEKAAITELMRVLKPDGTLFLSVPISLAIDKTIEDPANDTPEKRLAAYGQDDHVRLYGQDFADRLRACVPCVEQIIAKQDMPELVKRYGLIPLDRNFLCRHEK